MLPPKILLRLEGGAISCAAVLFYRELGESWLKFFLAILAPDLALLAYLFGRRFGASVYNLFHHYAGPFVLWTFVYFLPAPSLFPYCLIWIAHIGADRLMGFGLKYSDSFKQTHLQKV